MEQRKDRNWRVELAWSREKTGTGMEWSREDRSWNGMEQRRQELEWNGAEKTGAGGVDLGKKK
jgi:hypothetical protein